MLVSRNGKPSSKPKVGYVLVVDGREPPAHFILTTIIGLDYCAASFVSAATLPFKSYETIPGQRKLWQHIYVHPQPVLFSDVI